MSMWDDEPVGEWEHLPYVSADCQDTNHSNCPNCKCLCHRRQFMGKRVTLVRWTPCDVIDDNLTVPPGTEGTVTHVDDAGTLFVEWDNGRHLGVTVEDEVSLS